MHITDCSRLLIEDHIFVVFMSPKSIKNTNINSDLEK